MATIAQTVTAIRRFNRYYTRAIGVLERGHLGGPYSLAENRVLYEVANAEAPAAKAIGERLGLDAGYLSRILARFEGEGLLARRPDPADRRSALLDLTPAGRAAFNDLDARQVAQVEDLVSGLDAAARARLAQAVGAIETLLAEGGTKGEAILRPHRPGDMGWVIERHATLYAREYGWAGRMEGLVALSCAGFLDRADPERERCWIAEQDGERLGSIFLMQETDRVARLRFLLLEPAARGLGLGRRLVGACLAFARAAGYREVVLWTHQKLTVARAIYAAEGFVIIETAIHDEFGVPEVGETWRLML